MLSVSSRKDAHPKCDACDFQRLKELENDPTVRNLRDKIEHLSFRLAESRAENQLLKRNLELARKMVFQEVGAGVSDFQALMKKGTEEGWKGRQESVLVLKKRVQELRDHLKELEGGDEARDKQGAVSQDFRPPSEKKRLWRMELERRLARESAEKDLNPLVRECHDLRKKLDNERGRFKELSQEVELLKAELQAQVAKTSEESGLVSSYRTMEKQLQETLTERANVRMELDGFRSRNKKLIEELDFLKKELELCQNKSRESTGLVAQLSTNQKAIQESIELEKAIVQQNVDRYKDDLETLVKNHAKDVDILDRLQNVMSSRNSMIDELRKEVDKVIPAGDKSTDALDKGKENGQDLRSRSSGKLVDSSESRSLQQTDLPGEDVQPASQPSSEAHQLRLDCERYKALCQAARIESTYLLNVVSRQEKLMNGIAAQVVETGQLAVRKNAERKELLDAIGRLQKAQAEAVHHRRRKKGGPARSRLDEVRIKCEAQKDENDFLRNFLVGALGSKAEDVGFYKECLSDYRHFFKAALKNIEDSVRAAAAGQARQQSEEQASEPGEN